jgi:hypothetical protein
MKKIIFITILIVFALETQAQPNTGFSYSYDDNGNRTERVYHDPLIKMGTYESYETELNQHKIQIFPNPTDGDLKVNIEGLNEDTESMIQIYNINGNKLYEVEGIKKTELNLTEQPNGIYILRIIIVKKALPNIKYNS